MIKLQIVPDTVVMTREEFLKILQKYKHHRDLRFGFSKKHTTDILKYRKSQGVEGGTQPSNLYDMPVEWNIDETYIGSK